MCYRRSQDLINELRIVEHCYQKVIKKQFLIIYLNLLEAYINANYYLSHNSKEIDFYSFFFSTGG